MLKHTVTIFKNLYDKEPHHRGVEVALKMVKNGRNKDLIEKIRNEEDHEKRSVLKRKLPVVLFSGKFSERNSWSCISHSGLAVLDFDHVFVAEVMAELIDDPYIMAAWVSPSGDGVKALVKIPKENHIDSFNALLKRYPDADKSGRDVSRACFNSFDPNLYYNPDSKLFSEMVKPNNTITHIDNYDQDSHSIYEKLKKWLEGRAEYFSVGNRNNYLYKLSCACNRFGIDKTDAYNWLNYDYVSGSDFTDKELSAVIKSAYKNVQFFNTAVFEKDEIVSIEDNAYGVVLSEEIMDMSLPPRNIITVNDVKEDLLEMFDNGIEKGETTHLQKLDYKFRWIKTDLNFIYGIPNAGKSTILGYLMYLKARLSGWVWIVYSPEVTWSRYFNEIAQFYTSKSVMKGTNNSMSREEYLEALDFINDHFFFLEPDDDDNPTPKYILERFRECIHKKKVDGVLIDPYNQMVSTQGRNQREDQYISELLREFKKFAKGQNICFNVIAHTNSSISLNLDGKIKTPFYAKHIAGGIMTANKATNVLCYHRENFYNDPSDPYCELISQKIKVQETTGDLGRTSFIYDAKNYRFVDPDQPLAYSDIQFQEQEDLPF